MNHTQARAPLRTVSTLAPMGCKWSVTTNQITNRLRANWSCSLDNKIYDNFVRAQKVSRNPGRPPKVAPASRPSPAVGLPPASHSLAMNDYSATQQLTPHTLDWPGPLQKAKKWTTSCARPRKSTRHGLLKRTRFQTKADET